MLLPVIDILFTGKYSVAYIAYSTIGSFKFRKVSSIDEFPPFMQLTGF